VWHFLSDVLDGNPSMTDVFSTSKALVPSAELMEAFSGAAITTGEHCPIGQDLLPEFLFF